MKDASNPAIAVYDVDTRRTRRDLERDFEVVARLRHLPEDAKVPSTEAAFWELVQSQVGVTPPSDTHNSRGLHEHRMLANLRRLERLERLSP